MHVPKRKAKRRYVLSSFANQKKTNKARFEQYGEFFARYIESACNDQMKPYFVTLTTQNSFTVKAARSSMNSYIKKLTYDCGANLRAIWCAEPFDTKEGYHLHALICTQLPKEQMKEVWREMNNTQTVDTNDRKIAAIHSNDNERYDRLNEMHGKKTQARSYFLAYDANLKKKSGGGGAGEYCAKYILKSMNSGDWDICDIRQYDASETIKRNTLTSDELLQASARGEQYAIVPRGNAHAVYIGDKF